MFDKFDKEKLFWLVIGFFLGGIAGVGGLTLSNRVQPAPIVIQPPEPTATPEPTVTPQPTATPGPIRVYVNGQVAHPAVYELSPHSIVEEAITAAGGFTAEANTAIVNLAQSLSDGAQIYVPSQAEQAPVAVVNNPVVVNVNDEAGSDTAVQDGGIININTAGIEALDTLPGIGPSTAQKIIEYRDNNGPFTAKEDIMNVSGIGEAKFAQIEEFITVEGE